MTVYASGNFHYNVWPLYVALCFQFVLFYIPSLFVLVSVYLQLRLAGHLP